ncbi:MAG: phage holin family protein [Bacteroidales bacterium]|nr:phage holin family protein [Bacteroidales bacterium]
MDIMEYIAPELIVLIPVLYLIGMAFKKSELVPDKMIPLFIGAIGIVLATLYVSATCNFCAESIFTAIVQGILCAGASVYVNQTIKQLGKDQ